jgi:hypothetical protein
MINLIVLLGVLSIFVVPRSARHGSYQLTPHGICLLLEKVHVALLANPQPTLTSSAPIHVRKNLSLRRFFDLKQSPTTGFTFTLSSPIDARTPARMDQATPMKEFHVNQIEKRIMFYCRKHRFCRHGLLFN